LSAGRFEVRDRHSCAVRTVVDLPDRVNGFDLRPDGDAVLSDGREVLYEVPLAGTPRRLAHGARMPQFAGDHIGFVRGNGNGRRGQWLPVDRRRHRRPQRSPWTGTLPRDRRVANGERTPPQPVPSALPSRPPRSVTFASG
jgi:hypothetical protein